jgi:hypothetical protein
MALTQTEHSGPFTRVDKQSVIGTLKATGSHDPDILYAQKQQLATSSRSLHKASFIIMGCGGLLTVIVITAFIGIPALLLGAWIWHFSKKNLATIEAAYSEYLASAHG